jgi:hypothetical protein
MDNKLVEDAKKAVDKVFSDESVDKETTSDRLTELQEHIEMLQDTLD